MSASVIAKDTSSKSETHDSMESGSKCRSGGTLNQSKLAALLLPFSRIDFYVKPSITPDMLTIALTNHAKSSG